MIWGVLTISQRLAAPWRSQCADRRRDCSLQSVCANDDPPRRERNRVAPFVPLKRRARFRDRTGFEQQRARNLQRGFPERIDPSRLHELVAELKGSELHEPSKTLALRESSVLNAHPEIRGTCAPMRRRSIFSIVPAAN